MISSQTSADGTTSVRTVRPRSPSMLLITARSRSTANPIDFSTLLTPVGVVLKTSARPPTR